MLKRIEDALAALSGAAAIAMMLLVTADVVFRYIWNRPIAGVAEVTELYLMVAIIYLTLSRTQRLNGHVRVTFLYERMRPLARRFADGLNLSLMLAVLGLITYASAEQASARWGGVLSGATPLPTGPSWVLIPIGTSLMMARIVVQLWRLRHEGPPNQDGATQAGHTHA